MNESLAQDHPTPASRLMAVELISNLLAATQPRELGRKLTEQLRELTGARVVLLVSHGGDSGAHAVLHACPERRAALFPAEELQLFCPEHTPDPLPRRMAELLPDHPLRAPLLRAGMKSLLRFPLYAGGELLGMLLLLDLPALDRIGEAVEIITLLSPPIALALRNALALDQIERQRREIQHHAGTLEERIKERTAELAAANADIAAARLAALNMMEDAVAARIRAEEINATLRHEIEERKKAETALRENEARLSMALEVSNAGRWEWNIESDEVRFDAWFHAMLGYAQGELPNTLQEWKSHHHPEDLPVMLSKARAYLHGDSPVYESEHRIRNKAGTWTWIFTRGKLVNLTTTESPKQFVGFAMDITQRKRAEAALQQSEQRKTILNQIAHIFLTASDQEMYAQVLGVVLQVMKSRFGIFGYIGPNGDLIIPSLTGEVWSECEVSGKSVVFAQDTWGESLWGRAVRERKTFCSDGPFHTPQGHIHIDHFLAVPIVFGDTTIGLLSVANAEQSYTQDHTGLLESIAESISPILNARMQRDLQEKKRQQAEAETRKLNAELETRVTERTAQLEAANKELESFSYSVSHDLRAPLRAISGFASILTEDCAKQLDEEGKRHLSIVSSEAKRMGQLIDDLLAFSRLGRQAMQAAQIDMDALVQKVFEECAAQAPDRKIQFKLHPLPPAFGDAALLHEVWVNLISNAIKYTRPRPVAEIEVTGKVEAAEIVYCVKDNGVGFDMKYVDRLFRVFQRLHSDTDFEGTGVGLSLVQRIVARHSGRVWADAKANEGATFYFTLPQSVKTGS